MKAEFDVIEIHAAHGYLLHEFLSPLTNWRTDDYGGPFENRTRLLIEALQAVREEWPEDLPIFVRVSATDWVEGGWDLDQSVELASRLGTLDVDLIDCSSGGIVPGVPTGAVGLITNPAQANAIVGEGKADVVLFARQLLRDPYWPVQYLRAAD